MLDHIFPLSSQTIRSYPRDIVFAVLGKCKIFNRSLYRLFDNREINLVTLFCTRSNLSTLLALAYSK